MNITHLELLTRNLSEQRNFYAAVLGLALVEAAAETFSVRIGESRLTFRQAPDDWNGMYHFAFNIPPHQYAEAKAWLAERVPLIVDASGNAEIYFPHWDAHALYFRDRGGHLVELIARHTWSQSSEEPFSPKSLLCLSEIGIVTATVSQTVQELTKQFGISVYRGEINEDFVAVGDESGLFIVVRRGRVWFLLDTPAEIAPVTVSVATENGSSTKILSL